MSNLAIERGLFLQASLRVGIKSSPTAIPTTYSDPINFTMVEYQPPEQETVRLISNIMGTVGESLATVKNPNGTPARMKLEFDTFSRQMLATILGSASATSFTRAASTTTTGLSAIITTVNGTAVHLPHSNVTVTSVTIGGSPVDAGDYTVDAAAGTVTATDVLAVGEATVAYSITGKAAAVTAVLNEWVPLAADIDDVAGVTVTGVKKAGVPVASTAYEVDGKLGLIKAIHADAVGALSIVYTEAAQEGIVYAGGKVTDLRIELIGTAFDKASGREGRLRVYNLLISQEEAFAIISNENAFVKGSMTGDAETPAGFNSPFEFKLLNVA